MPLRKKPVSAWQRQQRVIREQAVLDAATELMGAQGFAATSMDDIAARVGISKPTLYQHFRSKNAIVEAVMLRNLSQADARIVMMEENIAKGERALHQLEAHIRDAIAVYHGLWASRAQIPIAVRDARGLRVRREQIWARYARIIDRAKADGDCRTDVPTALLVRSVVRVFRGDFADLIDDGTVTLDDLAHALVSLLFDGMVPRSPSPPATPQPRRRTRRSGIASLLMSLLAFGAPLAAQSTAAPSRTDTAGTPALTLADVLARALRNNPSARAAVAEAQVSDYTYDAARGAWFPTVSFVPAFVVSRNTAANSGAALSRAAAQRVTLSPSISLSYVLFDIGGRAGTVGAARDAARASEFSRDGTVQLTVLGAEQAYFTYQAAQGVVLAQSDNVGTASANRDATVARFSAGIATVADTLQAATALAQARVALVAARVALVNARTAVATVMGTRADGAFRVANESAPTTGDVRTVTSGITGKVDTLIAHALRARPDVAQAAALTAAAAERVRVARSALLPSLQLTAATGRTLANQNALDGSNYSVQVGLALPLFDGGTRHNTMKAAQAEVVASRAREEAIDAAAANAVVTSVEALRLAAEQVVTTDESLASAQQSENVAQGRYVEGVGSIVDLIAAQSALATARAQVAQARWNWATALSQLARDAAVLGPAGELPVSPGALPPTSRPGSPDGAAATSSSPLPRE